MIEHKVEENIAFSKQVGLTRLASDIDLEGKTVLVTGGAAGIGRELVEGALRFGAEKVVIVDIRDDGLAELKQKFGDRVATIRFDISEREDGKVAAFTQQIRDALNGKLDVVFSNIGVVKLTDIHQTSTLAKTPVSEMDHLFKINASGNHLLYQAVGDLLAQSPSPRYIATTSPIVGRTDPSTAGYAITKAAQEAYLQNLVTEMKEVPGMIVAAIDPGRVQTSLRRDIYDGEPLFAQPVPVDIVESFLRTASSSAAAALLHKQVLIVQNTVADPLMAGGKSYKVSQRTENGFLTSLAMRPINALGTAPESLLATVDTYDSRRLMGADPAPAITMENTLEKRFPAPGQGLPSENGKITSLAKPFIVLHDRDNNLVSEDVTFHAYRKLLADQGQSVGVNELAATWVGKRYETALKSFEEQYQITIGDPTIADERKRFQQAYEQAVIAAQKEHQKTLPGVVGTLAILAEAGVPMGITTNNSHRVCAEGNKVAGIDAFIPESAIYSGDHLWQIHPDKTLAELTGGKIGFKPAPDLYRFSLQQQNARPELAIAVEDSLSGIKAAKAAGIVTIVANTAILVQEQRSQEEIDHYIAKARQAGATDMICNYAELLPIVVQKAPPDIAQSVERIVGKLAVSKRGGMSEKSVEAARLVEIKDGKIPGTQIAI